MARPKTNHIEPDEILQAVWDRTVGPQLEIDRKLPGVDPGTFQALHRARREYAWARYSIRDLIGQHLTDAEVKARQRLITELETTGLLVISGRRIHLTERGVEQIQNGLDRQKTEREK